MWKIVKSDALRVLKNKQMMIKMIVIIALTYLKIAMIFVKRIEKCYYYTIIITTIKIYKKKKI